MRERTEDRQSALARTDRAALRSGDSRAFDSLYDRCAPRVFGYLLRLTNGCRSEAEDLTQETFLAAYRGREAFGGRNGALPLTWLLGIARRRWRDGRRSAQAQADDVASTLAEEETLPAAGPRGGDHADQVATAATLEAAMARLPEPQREALLLTAVEGLTYAEAARILETPVGTVKWRVHEATRTLRQVLGPEDSAATFPPTVQTTARAGRAEHADRKER